MQAQCNRRYPCNRCLRRRMPEDCLYASRAPAAPSEHARQMPLPNDAQSSVCFEPGISNRRSSWSDAENLELDSASSQPRRPSLGEFFGYFENNGESSLELLRRAGPLSLTLLIIFADIIDQ